MNKIFFTLVSIFCAEQMMHAEMSNMEKLSDIVHQRKEESKEFLARVDRELKESRIKRENHDLISNSFINVTVGALVYAKTLEFVRNYPCLQQYMQKSASHARFARSLSIFPSMFMGFFAMDCARAVHKLNKA